MEEKNPFHGIKTCGSYTHLWRLTGFVILLQVAVSVVVSICERRSSLTLSPFESIIPALLVTGYVSWAVLKRVGVSWRAALASWNRGTLNDIKKAFKYFAGYAVVLLCVAAFLYGAYALFGDHVGKVMRPLSEKNTAEDSLLQGIAVISRLRFLTVLFCACVLGPVVEEVFFRRIVYTTLRFRKGFWFSAFWSGLLFAVFHGVAAPVILPVGMYLCWVYERERRLPVNIILHSLVNLSMITLKVLL